MTINQFQLEQIVKKCLRDLRAIGLDVDEADIKDHRLTISGEDARKAGQAAHFEKMAERASEPDMRREYRDRAKRIREEIRG
jgi:hypothetical protein